MISPASAPRRADHLHPRGRAAALPRRRRRGEPHACTPARPCDPERPSAPRGRARGHARCRRDRAAAAGRDVPSMQRIRPFRPG